MLLLFEPVGPRTRSIPLTRHLQHLRAQQPHLFLGQCEFCYAANKHVVRTRTARTHTHCTATHRTRLHRTAALHSSTHTASARTRTAHLSTHTYIHSSRHSADCQALSIALILLSSTSRYTDCECGASPQFTIHRLRMRCHSLVYDTLTANAVSFLSSRYTDCECGASP